MVRVVNGEILQDDDPRLRQPPPSTAGSQAAPQSHGQDNAPAAMQGLDWNAPPVQLIQDVPGSFMGLPHLAIFGVEVEAIHYSLLIVATLAFGWNGFIGGAILLVVMYANRGAQQPPGGAATGTTMRLRPRGQGENPGGGVGQGAEGAGGFVERFFTQPPVGRRYGQHGPQPGPGAAGPGDGGGGGGSSSSNGRFQGTGRKLGSG